MPRKAKKKVHPMPKLGFWDGLVYWVLMMVGYGGSVACVFAPMVQRWLLAESNPNALACDMEVAEILYGFWLALWLLVMGMIVTLKLYKPRIPIFGRSDIQYGPPAYPRIYPVLMKNKPTHWESQSAVRKRTRNRRILAGILIVTLLFSAAVFPLSLYSRQELLRDGTVMAYDSRNQPTHYDLEDLESVRLYIGRSGGRHQLKKCYPYLEIRLRDGTLCVFFVKSMGDGWTDALQNARKLKECYGDLLVIEAGGKLESVVIDNHLSAVQRQLLYELFEISMP
jgi:hypothetical protein